MNLEIKIRNSECIVNELNDKRELKDKLISLLSYEKSDAFYFRKKLIEKWNEAKKGFSQYGNNFKTLRPDLYRLSFIPYNKLQEFIEKNTVVRLFNSSLNTFPTGLLNNVTNFLKEEDIAFSIKDFRIQPTLKHEYVKQTKSYPLRYYQTEILNITDRYPRGVIEAATGTGKTLIIKELIYRKELKTLVVVPSSNILNIFDEQLKDLFGKNKVGLITGGKKQFDKPITIATYQSLPKVEQSFFDDIGMLIIDEFHHCLKASTGIITDQGERCISEIVNKKMKCKIRSYNIQTGKTEWKNVTNYWKYPRTMNMIKINYKDDDGKTKELICTPNHKIYTKNRGYVLAEELTDADDIVVHDNLFYCNVCDYSTKYPRSLSGHKTANHFHTKESLRQCALHMIKSPNRNSPKARLLNSLSKRGDKNVSKRPEVSIEKIKTFKNRNNTNKYHVYDIEVEDNRNYFANGLLVSNSGALTLTELNLTQFKNIYYRYGFTATFYRNDESDLALKGVLSDTLYKYDVKAAIKDKFLCPINFVIYKNNNCNTYNNWRTENKEALIKNTQYNLRIAAMADKLNKSDIPTLIFVNEIEHGETLRDLIKDSVFISGKEKRSVNKQTLEDFNNRKFNIMIGTSVIGEGVDTVPARVGILASGFKADSEVVQKIGRLLRPHKEKESATFIDFMNIGSKYLNRHYETRLKIYQRYEGNIVYKDSF